ncbi:MAG: hypothetical protein IPJ36_10360 [Simplicispira sp.]|nr:hypothetical protein [Simplicispira sp.]
MKRFAWPLPALLAWGAAWVLYLMLGRHLPALWALLLACALPAAASPWAAGWRRARRVRGALRWRCCYTAPPLYDQSGWYRFCCWSIPWARRDAPLFLTPHGALSELKTAVPLPVGARLLDAGCHPGDGLIALRPGRIRRRTLKRIERSRLPQWLRSALPLGVCAPGRYLGG